MSYMFVKVRGLINPLDTHKAIPLPIVKIPEYNCTLTITKRPDSFRIQLRSKAFDSKYTPDAKSPIEKDFIIIWQEIYEYKVILNNNSVEYKFYDCAYVTSAETHRLNPTKRISVDIDESALRSDGEIREEKIKEEIINLTRNMDALLKKKESIIKETPDDSYAIGLCDRDILVCQDRIDEQKAELSSLTKADYDINRQSFALRCKNCLSVTYSVLSQNQIDGLYGCEVYNDNGRLVWGNTFVERNGKLSGASRWILDAYNLRVKENTHPNMVLPYIVRELTEDEKRAYMAVCKYGMFSTGSVLDTDDDWGYKIYLSNDMMDIFDLVYSSSLGDDLRVMTRKHIDVVIDPRREDNFQG